MRLTALVKSPEHVSCRYRLTAFQPHLEQAGYHLELRTWPRSWFSRFVLRRELAHADAVIAQRSLLHGWQLRLIRRAIDVFIYDFDDAVFVRNSYAADGPHSSTRARRFAAAVRAADAVVAGNDFLAKEAMNYAGPAAIHVIPTCVPTDRYRLAAHDRAGQEVQMVWIGSSSTLRGLEAIAPILESIGKGQPGVRLKLLCDRFLHLQHLPVIEQPWSEAGETSALAEADIGISWLPDDVWSRGKCGLKVLQYMAAGLPVVANPVGVQADMVRHGETGFLAQTPEEWVYAIGRLASDPALRQRMGEAGRRRVETDFSVNTGASHWVQLLDSVVRRQATRLPEKVEQGWS
jgi:glycosyltransferase involved in cell wall biosynthesis